jgi:putative heme transporter
VVNDLSAHLLGVVTVPPGDLVLRVAMFATWGIEATRAIAGTVLNMLAFYLNRFAAPVWGVLLLLPVRFDRSYALTSFLSGGVAVLMVVLLRAGLRNEALARRLGTSAGTVVARLRTSVDPGHWGSAVVDFRATTRGVLAAGLPSSMVALLGLVLIDASMLLLSMRFVGIGPDQLPSIEVYAAFLCLYPVTLLPSMGLGVLDTLLLATLIGTQAQDGPEGAVVAALVVWRAFTLLGPVLLGGGALGIWKWTRPRTGNPSGNSSGNSSGQPDPAR